MAEITSAGEKIFEEEVSYKAAVSEATFTKIGGSINYILDNASDYVGQVETAMLSEAQFATIKNYDYTETDLTLLKWIIMDGQDVTGSDYATLTGITTLPSVKTNEAFPGQAAADGNIADYETSQNKAHTHNIDDSSGTDVYTGAGAQNNSVINAIAPGAFVSNTRLTTESDGATDGHPNTFRVNYFLRINS